MADDCLTQTSQNECEAEEGCKWMSTTDGSGSITTQCQCNTQVSVLQTNGLCIYCNPELNFLPGETACVCKGGYGQNITEIEPSQCYPCESGYYHAYNSSEPGMVQCTQCTGDHMVVDSSAIMCTCDYANNFVLIDSSVGCQCKNGYTMSSDNTTCTAQSSTQLSPMSIVFILTLLIIAIFLSICATKKFSSRKQQEPQIEIM